jgi:hypothetical protein
MSLRKKNIRKRDEDNDDDSVPIPIPIQKKSHKVPGIDSALLCKASDEKEHENSELEGVTLVDVESTSLREFVKKRKMELEGKGTQLSASNAMNDESIYKLPENLIPVVADSKSFRSDAVDGIMLSGSGIAEVDLGEHARKKAYQEAKFIQASKIS